MIYLLLRETHMEVPEHGNILVERTPIAAFSDLDGIDIYAENKGYTKTGEWDNAIYTRETDLIPIRNQFKKYFQTHIPMKAKEIFVIHPMEVRS